MNNQWNLDLLYKGFEDPKYEADFAKLETEARKLEDIVKEANAKEDKLVVDRELAEKILTVCENKNQLLMDLINYVELSMTVDTENGQVLAQYNRVMKLYSEGVAWDTAAEKILGKITDVDALAKESSLVADYSFYLGQIKKKMSYMLSDELEAMAAAMDMTGGSAWGRLQSYLTSTLKVDYAGKQVTLPEIRNLAYDTDPKVRKEAYEAELAAYEKVEDSIAYSLNNIKQQVNMMAAKRGYESALDQSLKNSRMSRKTLDAMMEAVEDYLPVFRKYLKKKAKILGYENGLPFYELFAPLATEQKEYSIEEAKEYLTTCFATFTPDMADLMKEAFENEWIDFYPRPGKEGGAFCAGLMKYKQSRVLTNYDGSFGAIDTLAHELGHAFHNRQMENERPLNQDYPMPVAETASTFNEVFLGDYALKKATSAEEKKALLESDLKEKTQCVVDIYSRYLFENAVCQQCEDKFLMAADLKELMLEAQKKSYGDGLDPQYMHPYMWACKSHYYSSGFSFYNYPYTFGNLFAQGLYALYLKEGDAFVEKYKKMLKNTGTSTIEEDGAALGIDLTSKDFWCSSLQMIADEIEEFCAL